MKFTPITRILFLATHEDCHPYSVSCRAIGKTPKTNTTQIVLNKCNEQITYYIIVSDEISSIYTLLYTKNTEI